MAKAELDAQVARLSQQLSDVQTQGSAAEVQRAEYEYESCITQLTQLTQLTADAVLRTMPSLYEELLEYERQKKAEQEASDERFAFSLMVQREPAAGAGARAVYSVEDEEEDEDEDEDEEDERGDDKEESRQEEDGDEDEDEESWEEEEEGEEEEDDDDDYEVEPPPKRHRKASQRKSSATASAPGAGGLNVFSLAAYLSKNANEEEELENEPNQALKRAVERFAKASPPARITIDPRVLDNPRPLWRKPLFLIEQVRPICHQTGA